MSTKLFQDVHNCLTKETSKGRTDLCRGSYLYYHYGCDGTDDRGWGCGYRTLQTICSWLHNNGHGAVKADVCEAPSLHQIQAALVSMEDKPESFKGSKQWIGSFEVCLCLDYFYDVPSKIIHLNAGRDIENHLEELAQHFQTSGSPAMMGGETDCASKGIMGVNLDEKALLIVDPHCPDVVSDVDVLCRQGFIKWLPISDLHRDSFYNLCLPKPSLKNK